MECDGMEGQGPLAKSSTPYRAGRDAKVEDKHWTSGQTAVLGEQKDQEPVQKGDGKHTNGKALR